MTRRSDRRGSPGPVTARSWHPDRVVPAPISGILDVEVMRGARAGAAIDLLIEVPHGATASADFTHHAAALASPLPAGLIDFFFVNTDAGAPELGLAIAARLGRPAIVLRCRIPRTFIDTNRRLDATADELRAGKVTPGVPPWITAPGDRAHLAAAYDRYVAAVRAARDALPPDGALLLLHSYAPRTVDV